MTEENTNSANIVKKKNGAVVFVALIFLISSLVLGWRVFAHVQNSRNGVYDSILESAAIMENARREATFRFSNTDYYEETEQRLIAKGKRSTIEGFVGGGLFITSIIMLCLSSKHCSECGTKVAIDTAKKCGSCGAQFKTV